VRIERTRTRCQVFVDDVDVSGHVVAVSWSMQAGKLPTATVTFHDVEVNVEAEDVPELENVEFVADLSKHHEELERLRKWAPGLVEAIESAKPVVARERVVNVDELCEAAVEPHEITTWKSHPMIGEYWQAMCSCGGGVTMLYRTAEAAQAAAEDHEPGMAAAEARIH
jgi:hypothetical protein